MKLVNRIPKLRDRISRVIQQLLQNIIIMNTDQIILEVETDQQQSEGYSRLDQEFFLELHQTQIRYVKLKYGRKTKHTQKQLIKVIIDLVAYYADCIDYFGSSGDAAVAYFQVKIKEVNTYFQFLNNQISPKHQQNVGFESESRKDLGSISEQTGPQLLPQEERSSVVGKEALNHNVIAYLQTQDIKSHIKQNMEREQKIHKAIANNLKKQDDQLMKRKKLRQVVSRNRIFLSFSQGNLDISRISQSQNSELINLDMEALEDNSPQQLRALTLKLDQSIEKVDDESEKLILQI